MTEAVRRLRHGGSPTPRLDAEVLLAHVTGHDRSWVLAHPEATIDDAAFEALITRRAAGEPIAYIRGYKEWLSLRIRTDARALIPRPETELLAQAVIEEIAARLDRAPTPTVVWEVATGSGAVSVAIARQFGDALEHNRLRLIASDVSPDALALAAENLEAHGVTKHLTLVRSDLLQGAEERPDVVIANLPYVASAEVDERVGSLGFEPRIALDGGPDGLGLLRRLIAQLPSRTAPGATALLEIGVGQVDVIRQLASPRASVLAIPDLAGLDRVMRIQMPETGA